MPRLAILPVSLVCLVAGAPFVSVPRLTTAHATGKDSWITFLSHRSGKNLLYKMRPDGKGLQVIFGGELKGVPGLSDGLTLHREPHWTRQSPDRKLFVSWATDTSWRKDKMVGVSPFVLRLGRTTGGSTRILLTACDESVAWSPDGKRVAVAVSNSNKMWPWSDSQLLTQPPSTRIFLLGIDGIEKELILEKPGVWEVEDWSPDGKKLLLGRFDAVIRPVRVQLVEYDLAALEADRKHLVEGAPWQSGPAVLRYVRPVLGDHPGVVLAGGRYSPDGKWVATTGWKPPDSPDKIWEYKDCELGLIDRARRKYRRVVKYREGLWVGPICWSPDGREVLFSRPLPKGDRPEKPSPGERPDYGIWAIRPDGKGERFLTTGWSPDWR